MPLQWSLERFRKGANFKRDLGEVGITLYGQECYQWTTLEESFINLRLQESKHMKPHIDEFYSIVLNKDLTILLLCSLSLSYKHFREICFYGMDTLCNEDVKKPKVKRTLLILNLHKRSLISQVRQEKFDLK